MNITLEFNGQFYLAEVTDNFNVIPIPAILGIILASLPFIYRLELIQKKFYELKQKDKKKILLPSFSFLMAPFLLTILYESNQDLLKVIIPLTTFFLGQFLTQNKYKRDLKYQELELINNVTTKLYKNKNLVTKNKEQINENDKFNRNTIKKLSKLSLINKEFEQLRTLQQIMLTENFQPVEYNVMIRLKSIAEIIEDFNETNKKYKNYIEKYQTGENCHVSLSVLDRECQHHLDEFQEYYKEILYAIYPNSKPSNE